ncbi:hypothetical protein IV41_GL001878 [Limosilactobacillus ingluviei]|uniref:Uncharacterized protein n=1 Tax=Limosilactobacillus ingluviei TaxID=148604 RepID=A0A0R2GW38_9LACO|nr:hypothetical protein IV41_GL001878 [Limosilactobacillus ingluviei]
MASENSRPRFSSLLNESFNFDRRAELRKRFTKPTNYVTLLALVDLQNQLI